MSEAPYNRSALINAIAEEGTKVEAVEYLQKKWNELCEAHDRIRELEGQRDMLVNATLQYLNDRSLHSETVLITVLRALAGEGE